MAQFSQPGRYENFVSFVQVRHYNFEPLLKAFGWTPYTTKAGQYIEDIAYAELKDGSLYYVLAAINNLFDQVLDPLPGGLKLRIPTQDVILQINKARRV